MSGGDLRRRLLRQRQMQLIQQHAVLRLRLRVARGTSSRPSAVGRCTSTICMDLNLVITSRGVIPRRPAVVEPERDLQAVRPERRRTRAPPDAAGIMVVDRPDRQIILQPLEGPAPPRSAGCRRSQLRRIMPSLQIGTQQVAAFAPARLCRSLARSRRNSSWQWSCSRPAAKLHQVGRAPGVVLRPPELHQQLVACGSFDLYSACSRST